MNHKKKRSFNIWYLKDNSFKIEIVNVKQHEQFRIINKYKCELLKYSYVFLRTKVKIKS